MAGRPGHLAGPWAASSGQTAVRAGDVLPARRLIVAIQDRCAPCDRLGFQHCQLDHSRMSSQTCRCTLELLPQLTRPQRQDHLCSHHFDYCSTSL
eukprot:3805294-Pleurochrysis_carterae.AAC.1